MNKRTLIYMKKKKKCPNEVKLCSFLLFITRNKKVNQLAPIDVFANFFFICLIWILFFIYNTC